MKTEYCKALRLTDENTKAGFNVGVRDTVLYSFPLYFLVPQNFIDYFLIYIVEMLIIKMHRAIWGLFELN